MHELPCNNSQNKVERLCTFLLKCWLSTWEEIIPWAHHGQQSNCRPIAFPGNKAETRTYPEMGIIVVFHFSSNIFPKIWTELCDVSCDVFVLKMFHITKLSSFSLKNILTSHLLHFSSYFFTIVNDSHSPIQSECQIKNKFCTFLIWFISNMVWKLNRPSCYEI